MGKLVAYYRVSTRKQGESGLGLEAQQACVADYARYGQHEIIAAYQEVETGKRADRPELAKAIAHAKRAKATLVIAKLDRLAQERPLPQRSDGVRGRVRVLRQPACQPTDSAHPGGRGRGRGPANQRTDQGCAGCLQGPWWKTWHAREPDAGGRPEGGSGHQGAGQDCVRGCAAGTAGLEGSRS